MDFVELLKQNALPASECIDDEIVLPINVAIDILKEQRSTNENNLSSIVLTT